MLPLRAWVGLGGMAMKGYSAFLKAPTWLELTKFFCAISRKNVFGGSYPSSVTQILPQVAEETKSWKQGVHFKFSLKWFRFYISGKKKWRKTTNSFLINNKDSVWWNSFWRCWFTSPPNDHVVYYKKKQTANKIWSHGHEKMFQYQYI